LYWCESWFLIGKKFPRFRMSENIVMRRIFASRKTSSLARIVWVSTLFWRLNYIICPLFTYHINTSTYLHFKLCVRGCIQKFSDWVDKEIYAYNNKHSLRSNTKCYGGKTHYIDSQNSDTSAPSDRDLYHLQFSLQAASLETFGYTVVNSNGDICKHSYEPFGSTKTLNLLITWTSTNLPRHTQYHCR
jgi:hypothetical protein